jgi:hypothetical protein
MWQRRGPMRLGFKRSACIILILAKLETKRSGPRRNRARPQYFLNCSRPPLCACRSRHFDAILLLDDDNARGN